jgi:hypothetical protein
MLGWNQTDNDGQYAVVGLPGRGIVTVEYWGGGLTRYLRGIGAEKIPEYRDAVGGNKRLDQVAPRKLHLLDPYHALAAVDPPDGAESFPLNFQLDPGQTLSGVVLDPDGKPLAGAHYTGLAGDEDGWHHPIATDKFLVDCYQPDTPRTLLFVHLGRKLAGSLTLKGEQPAPLSVRLEPWGAITGRVVDKDGKPIVGAKVESSRIPQHLWAKGPDGSFLYVNDFYLTDEDGRFRVEGLAPGVKYSIYAHDQRTGKWLGDLISDATVESGQTKDLGDLVPKPKQPADAAK